MDELQVKFDEQEKEYVVMFAEKEAEEEEYLNRLAFEFLTNRAAKTIQKCWREYWARKMARRKARKSKFAIQVRFIYSCKLIYIVISRERKREKEEIGIFHIRGWILVLKFVFI